MLPTDCPGLLDLATIAGFYSQLTGVLAGFALTSLAILLGSARRTLRNEIISVLFAAFVALILTALAYAILAGDTDSRAHGRAATLQLIDGVPFGLAAIMLFYGVALLLVAHGVGRVPMWTARILSVVVAPTLTMYYIVNGATDVLTAHNLAGGTCTASAPPPIGLLLTIALALILAILQIPLFRSEWLKRLATGIPIVVVLATVVAAAVGGYISTQPASTTLSIAGVTAYILGVFGLMLVLGLMLSFGFPSHEGGNGDPSTERRVAPAPPQQPVDGRGVVGTAPIVNE